METILAGVVLVFVVVPWVVRNFIERPPLAPEPEGATGPTGSDAACQVTRHDGPIEICLRRVTGRWHWRATSGPNMTANGGPFATEQDATVDAWITLRPVAVPYVIGTDRDAVGLRLARGGDVTVVSLPHYLNAAAQWIAEAEQSGDDAAGVVLHVLLGAFGYGWNPLRAKIAGGAVEDAAERYDAAPANPQARAKAIMGVP